MELETGDRWKMSILEVKASRIFECVLEDGERSQVVKTDGSLDYGGRSLYARAKSGSPLALTDVGAWRELFLCDVFSTELP